MPSSTRFPFRYTVQYVITKAIHTITATIREALSMFLHNCFFLSPVKAASELSPEPTLPSNCPNQIFRRTEYWNRAAVMNTMHDRSLKIGQVYFHQLQRNAHSGHQTSIAVRESAFGAEVRTSVDRFISTKNIVTVGKSY